MSQLRYFGHSCFMLTHEWDSLIIDPFLSANPLARAVPPDVRPKLILVTHGHDDHVGDALNLAKRFSAKILATFELAKYFEEQGADVIAAHLGGTVKMPWGWVKLVPAMHSSSVEGGKRPAGHPCGFLLNVKDKVYYHAGDTCLFGDMKLIGEMAKIHIAMLPIGDHFTMGIDDAVKATALLNPEFVVPMHFKTFDTIKKDPGEFKTKVEAATAAKCLVMQPGSTMEVPVAAAVA